MRCRAVVIGHVCCAQNAAPGSSTYTVCPSCCGVIPRHQCGPSPPHVVGCARHCSAASPGLTRPSPPPLLMQHAPTSGPGATGFQQPPPRHVHDCPCCRLSVDDRPPLVEPGYHASSWPDPVTVQCPVHGRYQPFVAGFHQTVCATDHLHLSHPHQLICHHQQSQQPLSHVYQTSYTVQSPPPPPSLINQSQYAYGSVQASGIDVDIAATSQGDWYYPYVELQHQPDCQLMSHAITAPLMQQHQQQRNVSGVGLVKTYTETDSQRLEMSVQSADNADTATSVTSHNHQLTTTAATAAAMPTCTAGMIRLSLAIR